MADPGDAAEAPRRFLSPCAPRFSRLSLPSPFGPQSREEARKPPGNAKGFGALFLFRPPAALGPSPSAGDTSKPGTMADAAWLRASAPLRGLLSRDCTGGAREAGLACADRRAGRRGPRRHKAHRPAHVTPRFVTRSAEPEPAGERKEPCASRERGAPRGGPAHRAAPGRGGGGELGFELLRCLLVSAANGVSRDGRLTPLPRDPHQLPQFQ